MNQYAGSIRRVFDESYALNLEGRKFYYKELVSFVREWLISLPEDYAPYLKALFFQGLLPEEHEKAMRAMEPLLICLCAPSIDREFIVSIFREYPIYCAAHAVELFRVHFDPNEEEKWGEVIQRYRYVVECLADQRVPWLEDPEEAGRFPFLRLYVRVFAKLHNGTSASQTVGATMLDYVESQFEKVKDLPASQEFLLSLRKRLTALLAGEADNPELVYSDPVLLEFLNRYSNKQLPPSLQLMVEEIYSGLSCHIDFVNGEIKY